MKLALFLTLGTLVAFQATAQTPPPPDTLLPRELAPVIVTTTRMATPDTRLPIALTVIDKYRIQLGQQQLSLYESMGGVPGLFAQNPDNFAQDLRVSIRGFGARSAFGIRGIRFFVDGIPETTPDGQSDIDNIDPSLLRRMEVLRGPSSGLYGNAAGGVISLQTDNAADVPVAELQASAGSFGFRSYQAKSGFRRGIFEGVVSVTRNETTGFRGHSRMESTILNSKLIFTFDSTTTLTVLANYGNSPRAEDPGGLTAAQVAADRQQAGAPNLRFNAGEAVQQGRVGLVFEKKMGRHLFFARTFFTKRAFTNRLAFMAAGAGAINRQFAGGSLQYQYTTRFGRLDYRIRVGLDLEGQDDRRQRFDNLAGQETPGKQTFKQVEMFRNGAGYVTQEATLGRATVLLGLRYDAIRLSVADLFLADGDQSGQRTFSRLNPGAGLTYALSKRANVYATVGTSFETPAMSELSNNPSGTGGFNPALNPQQATNLEVGTKTYLGTRFRVDVAVFQIGVQDELIPYQLAAQPGRVFFRNAGQTSRRGLEVGLSATLGRGLTVYGTYTFSDFWYTQYQTATANLNGNVLPGVPRQTAYGELRFVRPNGFFLIGQVRLVGSLFADDANLNTSPAYTTLNLRTGYSATVGRFLVEPFAGVNNLFGAEFNQNVLLNAANGRFYEPSVGQYWFGGLKLAVQKRGKE